MPIDALKPPSWLVFGLPWAQDGRSGMSECAVAIAPALVPRSLLGRGARITLDFAHALACELNNGPGKTVFLSDVTHFVAGQGKTWADIGIDYEEVMDELTAAPVPQLFLTLSQKAHAILCDASIEGTRLYYPDGSTEHVTTKVRRDVHDAMTVTLERDWPRYMRGLMDSGVIRTQ